MHRAFIVTIVNVQDADAFATYRAAIASVNDRLGGDMLARGTTLELLEGDDAAADERVVVIGFDSVDAARDYIRSPDYQAAQPLRDAAGRFRIRLVG